MSDAEKRRRRREKIASERAVTQESWLENYEKLEDALWAFASMLRRHGQDQSANAWREERLEDIEAKAFAAIWPD
jgi:hypothetical protein